MCLLAELLPSVHEALDLIASTPHSHPHPHPAPVFSSTQVFLKLGRKRFVFELWLFLFGLCPWQIILIFLDCILLIEEDGFQWR